MKLQLIVFLLAIGFPLFSGAQTCDAFMAFEEGTKLTYTYYDKKEREEGSSTQYIREIESLADGGSRAVFQMKMRDKKGKEAMSSTFEVLCRESVLQMNVSDLLSPDMSGAFQEMEVTVEGDALEFPHDMEVGQSLPDASSTITPSMSGVSLMKFNFEVTERKVEAQESVTTPAGTFDCLKITSNFKTKTMGTREFTQAQWYAKGVGMVKSETYDKKGKLANRQLLTGFEKR
jgi:hypothetical protein